ncbi:hypothetical protein QR680_000824 [Steinernema hermaphroditum]|uniref:Uncharacterized protein n=1 Tax=Steinernema hermaphroditum TaxID=289476 RepID=A0AA39LER8_9BILA|nr:hypothetical protein QR680_000824 [Steinernema hermaphroditum]
MSSESNLDASFKKAFDEPTEQDPSVKINSMEVVFSALKNQDVANESATATGTIKRNPTSADHDHENSLNNCDASAKQDSDGMINPGVDTQGATNAPGALIANSDGDAIDAAHGPQFSHTHYHEPNPLAGAFHGFTCLEYCWVCIAFICCCPCRRYYL